MRTREPKRRHRHISPVNTREELIYLLSRASEIEHGLCCVYLFSAYSLKSDTSEGLTDVELSAVSSWKRSLVTVAIEEMLHLAQVTNLLTAIGGAPHFFRPNFPLPPDAFPFGIELTLEPFSEAVLERLVCYEMPERGVLSADRRQFFDAMFERVTNGVARRRERTDRAATEPFEIDFHTIGEFYHKIETGFRAIPEDVLFIGPIEAQARPEYLDSGKLIRVTDRASACAAIEMIIEQGEAPTAYHPESHFEVFDTIRLKYLEMKAAALERGAFFEPARPVISNSMTHNYSDARGGNVITNRHAHEVADIFNGTYDTMLLMLLRFFAHDGENEEELRLLSRGTLRMMASVLRPLGEALTKIPAGRGFPGMTAGPGFGYNREIHLLPHHDAAWVFIVERLRQLVARIGVLASAGNVPPEIAEAAAALESVTDHLAPLLPQRFASAQPMPRTVAGTEPSILCEPNGPYLVANLEFMSNSKGDHLGTRAALALCRCGGSALKPYCDGTHARIGFRSEKLPSRTPDRLDKYEGKDVVIYDNRGTCCHSGNCSDHLPSVFRVNQEPWIDPNGASKDEIISIVRACPSGALGYAEGTFRYTGEERRRPEIYVSEDGPYHVTGGIPLQGEQRNEGASLEHYALCRCGQSKDKPFCDGSHWYAKFHDEDN